MKRSASKTITVFFLMHFLLWMQLGAAQWYCQCDHTSIEQSCHIPQNRKVEDSCCANPQPADGENSGAAATACHDEPAANSEQNASSPCSDMNESEASALTYSASAYFCQTACQSLVTVQSKELLLREPLKKGWELPLAVGSAVSGYAITRISANIAFQQSFLLLHSPPLFLMHSSFLI